MAGQGAWDLGTPPSDGNFQPQKKVTPTINPRTASAP